MPYQNKARLVECLKDYGLVVHVVPGCETAGSSDFDPKGHLLHHDAGSDPLGTHDDMPGYIRTGRPDLAGPLANFWLETDGDVHICALGKANHGGLGVWLGLNENAELWGTEMNNRGTPATPWPQVQLDASYRLCKATCDFSGFTPAFVAGHKEYALPHGRKPDPHSINMADYRRKVAAATKGNPNNVFDREAREYLDDKFKRGRLRDVKILRTVKKVLVKQGATKADIAELDRELAELDEDLPEGEEA